MKTIEIELPKGFMNVDITFYNCLTANTNNSAKWDTLKFPLPKGKWKIKGYKGNYNKVVILIDNRNWLIRLITKLIASLKPAQN